MTASVCIDAGDVFVRNSGFQAIEKLFSQALAAKLFFEPEITDIEPFIVGQATDTANKLFRIRNNKAVSDLHDGWNAVIQTVFVKPSIHAVAVAVISRSMILMDIPHLRPHGF